MPVAKKGDILVIEYTIRTKDGRVIDGTEKRGPDTLKLGETEIFPQVTEALDGMEVGTRKSVIVPSANACGPRREDLIVQIPRENLPQDKAPQPGMTISMSNKQDGSTLQLVILDVNETTVTADGNHPLAGEDFHFDLKLVEIKQAA